MSVAADPTRLFLVTPAIIDRDRFVAQLSDALARGHVAAVLVTAAGDQPSQDAAEQIVPIIQAAGAAALIADDTRVAGRLGADGVHIGTGREDLRSAVQAFAGKRSVGAGNLHSRHAAMEAAEAGADYVFFGRPHGDTHEEAHAKVLDLAEWWSELMEIPAVVMAGRALGSVADTAATGAAFVALHEAVWSHPAGAGEAVRRAAEALNGPGRRAA